MPDQSLPNPALAPSGSGQREMGMRTKQAKAEYGAQKQDVSLKYRPPFLDPFSAGEAITNGRRQDYIQKDGGKTLLVRS